MINAGAGACILNYGSNLQRCRSRDHVSLFVLLGIRSKIMVHNYVSTNSRQMAATSSSSAFRAYCTTFSLPRVVIFFLCGNLFINLFFEIPDLILRYCLGDWSLRLVECVIIKAGFTWIIIIERQSRILYIFGTFTVGFSYKCVYMFVCAFVRMPVCTHFDCMCVYVTGCVGVCVCMCLYVCVCRRIPRVHNAMNGHIDITISPLWTCVQLHKTNIGWFR